MSALKKQHFLPQFYMRNFGIWNTSNHQNEAKLIGLFNKRNKRLVFNASIKDQAFKKYYYDNDGEVEKVLSLMEGNAAPLIKRIIAENKLPANNQEISSLLTFIALTHYRNPIQASTILTQQEDLKSLVDEAVKKENGRLATDITPLPLKNVILFLLSLTLDTKKMLSDLAVRLVINETDRPFITSDNPVILYNQLTELKKWHFSGYGIVSKGLQIFFPLSPKHMVILYDDWAYKFVKRGNVESAVIHDANTISQLNILQFKNCSETVYFNQDITKDYIHSLFYTSEKFPDANKSKINVYGDIFNVSAVGVKTNLSLPFFSICKHAKLHYPTIGWQAMRPGALWIKEEIDRIKKQ